MKSAPSDSCASLSLTNLDEILTVEGLGGVYVGTVDLSISMGLGNIIDFSDPDLKNAMAKILNACAKYHRVAGIHSQTPQIAGTLSGLGFRLITAANDSVLLRSQADELLAATRREISVHES
jgi:4-hydroxy-2-oxoheptanedioate aldolase